MQRRQHSVALHSAAEMGALCTVRKLIEWGDNVNEDVSEVRDPLVSGEYRYPLHAALDRGHEAVANELIRAGADVNATSYHHGTPLRLAALRGLDNAVSELLSRGVDVNAQDENAGTALAAAAAYGKMGIILRLLAAGAKINVGSNYYMRCNDPLHHALAYKYEDIASYFILTRASNVNSICELHGTALQVAARSGLEESVDLLLIYGAIVDEIGGDYGTALHAASMSGNLTIVKRLLAQGANVNLWTAQYGSALTVASKFGHLQIVEVLKAAANPDYSSASAAVIECNHPGIADNLKKADENTSL